MGKKQEDERKDDRRPGGGTELSEVGGGICDVGKRAHESVHGVLQHPAGYDGIVAEYQRHTKHAGVACKGP